MKVAIIGAGLAGMSTAVELLDQGHEVCISLFFLKVHYIITHISLVLSVFVSLVNLPVDIFYSFFFE